MVRIPRCLLPICYLRRILGRRLAVRRLRLHLRTIAIVVLRLPGRRGVGRLLGVGGLVGAEGDAGFDVGVCTGGGGVGGSCVAGAGKPEDCRCEGYGEEDAWNDS